MEPLPHHYVVTASAATEGNVTVSATGLTDITTAPPSEFGGPGDQWSPEALLMAAVADCFILTFRAVARASKLEWLALDCSANGTLDRVDRTTQFTAVAVRADLTLPADADTAKAEKLLHKAEQACLITNSLVAETTLDTSIKTA